MIGERSHHLFGTVEAVFIKDIMALDIQYPSKEVVVPEEPHVNKETVLALVDFHKCKYKWPASYTTIAHQLMAANFLGDDSFMEYIAATLKVPVARLESSNTFQAIKMAVRDRLKLTEMMDLKISDNSACFLCKFPFLSEKILASAPCCGWRFHRSCIQHRLVCPYCTTPWAGLPCAFCSKATMPKTGAYEGYKRRLRSRLVCCGADAHFRCRKRVLM